MSFINRLFSKSVRVDPALDWSQIWTKYASTIAPLPELATTRQQLIVTCAGVIDKIWNVNGGGGWDESCESDYIQPLRTHLSVDAMFSKADRTEIDRCLDTIASVGRKNCALEAHDDKDTYFESDCGAAERLISFVVRWCHEHPDPIPLLSDEEYHGHD
jgi:hypothetical protein